MTTGPRASRLATHELHSLNEACKTIRAAFGAYPYLVGTAGIGSAKSHRDVDVRLILGDERFDELFRDGGQPLWELLSLSIGAWLRERTGLPIDFQVQRMTEANERHGQKARNPLGTARNFAGGGDGTPTWKEATG